MIEPTNGFIVFEKLSESRKMGEFELISEHDTDYRYAKGRVHSCAPEVPLEKGDDFLYEVRQAFDVYVDEDIYCIVHASKIIGKVNEGTK